MKIDIESLGRDYQEAYDEDNNKYADNEINGIRENIRNTIFKEMKSYELPKDYPKEINTPFKKKFYAGIQSKKSLNNKKKLNEDLEKMANIKNLWGVNIFDKHRRM